MKIWVDYTNHRGERRWREIVTVYAIEWSVYPPKAEVHEQRMTLCIEVLLADRADRRTLALTSCHAFVESVKEPPVRELPIPVALAQILDRFDRLDQYKPSLLDGFDTLRRANTLRQDEWDRDGQLTGNLGALYLANELAGETGEACNIVKKLVRGDLNIAGSRASADDLAQELADVVICADLLAEHFGIELGVAVRKKFNATSQRRNLVTRL